MSEAIPEPLAMQLPFPWRQRRKPGDLHNSGEDYDILVLTLKMILLKMTTNEELPLLMILSSQSANAPANKVCVCNPGWADSSCNVPVTTLGASSNGNPTAFNQPGKSWKYYLVTVPTGTNANLLVQMVKLLLTSWENILEARSHTPYCHLVHLFTYFLALRSSLH